MAELPTGTVTFLFTDIEGSTRLLKRLGARYDTVLADHQRILRECFEAHRGREVDTQETPSSLPSLAPAMRSRALPRHNVRFEIIRGPTTPR